MIIIVFFFSLDESYNFKKIMNIYIKLFKNYLAYICILVFKSYNEGFLFI